MQHISTVDSELRHLSVHAGDAVKDVVLSAILPVDALIPAVVDLLGVDIGSEAARLELVTVCGSTLDGSKTLAQLRIDDGSIVSLVRSSTSYRAPACDDTAERVATIVGNGPAGTSHLVETVSVWTAVGSAAVGAIALSRAAFDTDHSTRAAAIGIAVAVCVLALLGATAAHRVAGLRAAALPLGLIAIGFAATAGSVVVPGGPAAPNAVLAAAMAAAVSVMMCAFAGATVVFAALVCFATICFVAAAAWTLTSVPVAAVGAAVAAVSLALVEVAPAASVAFAGLAAQPVPDVPQRAHRADVWLAGSTSAFSASAALSAVAVLTESSWQRPIFTAVVGGLLLLRARSHRDTRRALPPLVCGAVAVGAGPVSVAAMHPHQALYVTGLAAALSFGIVGFGLTAGPATVSPVYRRGLELAEYLGFAAVVPLSMSLCGVFGAVRGMNLP